MSRAQGRPVYRRGRVVRRVLWDQSGTAVLVLGDWSSRCGYCEADSDPQWTRCPDCQRIFHRVAPSWYARDGFYQTAEEIAAEIRPDLTVVAPVYGDLHDLENEGSDR